MRVKGKIISWNDEKGFGFISPLSGKDRVFIHIKSFSNRNRRPEKNQIVTYGISTDAKGRKFAVKATLVDDRLSQKRVEKNGSLSIIIALLFLIFVGVLVFASKVHPVILGIYIGISLLAFIMYAIDKSASQNGEWRTPENTLHFLSLIGGWPGALIAQKKLRHKSRKQPFRFIFFVTIFINLGIFAWLFTPKGLSVLQFLISGAQ